MRVLGSDLKCHLNIRIYEGNIRNSIVFVADFRYATMKLACARGFPFTRIVSVCFPLKCFRVVKFLNDCLRLIGREDVASTLYSPILKTLGEILPLEV